MAQSTPSPIVTAEEFLRLPEDGRRHQLLGGVHQVTPAPATRHQRIARNLLYLLEHYLRRHPAGELFAAPYDVVLSPTDVVEPDLLYVGDHGSATIGQENLKGPPDLVIEILSPTTRSLDRGPKRELYDRSGVGEYWMVDPERQAVEVLRRDPGGQLEVVARLRRSAGDRLTSPLLPSLAVDLEEVFP